MQAKICQDMIGLSALYHHEGLIIAEVFCHDYDHFRTLPQAIEVEGEVLGKLSWNSDRLYACYKNSAILARVIDNETRAIIGKGFRDCASKQSRLRSID